MVAKRILLVEKEAGIRGLMAMVLGREGFEVAQASSESEVRSLVAELGPFDLVIANPVMPDVGGVPFERWLRREYTSPKVLFVTGYDEEIARRFGIPLAEIEVLRKPFLPAQLLDRVKPLLERSPAAPFPGAAVRGGGGNGPAARSRGVVLVIDDDGLARGVYAALLKEDGFEVVTASDGMTGIGLFKNRRFDCVILDIYMPGLTGLDVIEVLDPETTGVPIIAISGSGEKTGVHPLHLAASLGAARTFTKDFEHEEFLQAVRDLTRRPGDGPG